MTAVKKQEMSDCAQMEVVEMDDECSGSNRHGGGGRRAFALE